MEIKKGIQILRQSRHNIIWKAVYFNASGLFLRLWRLPHNQYKSDKFVPIRYEFKYLLVNFGSQNTQFINTEVDPAGVSYQPITLSPVALLPSRARV